MQKNNKRQSRNSNVPTARLAIPFDVTKFGSEDDPCFGKLYDLTTPECQGCGDNELCAIATLTRLKGKRLKWEQENSAQDLEIDKEALTQEVKAYMIGLLNKGYTELRAHKKTMKKFHIHETTLKQILNG